MTRDRNSLTLDMGFQDFSFKQENRILQQNGAKMRQNTAI